MSINSLREGTYGSRTKLAQVYPNQFCQDLAHVIMRHLKVKPLDNEVYLLEDIFEPFTDKQVEILRQEMVAIDREFNMTSSSTSDRIQDLPFNKNVPPLVINSQLVQKFQRTLKQYPSGTEIDVFKQNPNDWRCQVACWATASVSVTLLKMRWTASSVDYQYECDQEGG